MRMRTQLLKWGVVVIVLLGMALFVTGISSYTAKAATLQETPPPAGTCELTWKNGGGGNITLYSNYVTDAGLKQTLQDYNLLCSANVKVVSGCILMPNSTVSSVSSTSLTPLYLENIRTSSDWVYRHVNGQYNYVICDASLF
jgi:hypothetical protein